MSLYLYQFLGIKEEEYENRIQPFMRSLFHKGGKVDQALLAIETNLDLTHAESVYCAYEVGLMVGMSPNSRVTTLKKLMRLELKD